MTKRPRFILLASLLFTCCLFLTACNGEGGSTENSGPTPEEMLIGSWRLKKLNMGPQPAPPQIMVNSSFNFHKNGRYEILMGELERGIWKLNENKNVLITTPDNNPGLQNMIDIEKITEDEVILYNKQAQPNPIRMVLAPS